MRKIIITETDQQRVSAVIAELRKSGHSPDDLDAVEYELARAEVVQSENVPRNVVTMNSTVVLRDLETNQTAKYTLVYPWEADISKGKISVFAPIGTAILGYQLGDEIEWEVPVGQKKYKIEHVLFQPEREGRFDL
ncbi:MAG TPA: nucleoside diphosphate kinase regulator [Oligoflexia bacterium]|nr:nucleoside diphosphate kinase regulator [Oligoflexia bacterium]